LRSDRGGSQAETNAAAPVSRALPAARRHLPGVQRALLVLGVVSLFACSGGDGDGADRAGSGQEDDPAELTASDGEPEATDAATVEPYVERLLVDYDDVVNQIVADPDVAADGDHPLIQQYLDLYEPDSDVAQQLVDVWAERGTEGLATRSFDGQHPASVTRLDGGIEVVSGDEVSFPACVERRLVVVDREGQTIQRTPYAEQQGEGVAVRVDGEWRLRDLRVLSGTAACRTGSDIETGTGGPGGTVDTGGAEDTGGTEGAEGA